MKKPPAKRSPPQSRSQASTTNHTHISVQSHSWEGPLPPPSVLEEFNRIVPNGAERIIRSWEEETQHRRDLDKAEHSKFWRDAMVGKIFAFLFVIAALAVAAFAAYLGAEWLAVVLGAGTITSVVWAFVHGKKPKA